MAKKYASSSSDEDSSIREQTLKICPLYNQNPASCQSSLCECFHLCGKYILENKCSQFEINGKCSHSHSFFTLHNAKILKRQYNLSLNDENIGKKLSNLIEYSSRLMRKPSPPVNAYNLIDLTPEQTKTSPLNTIHSRYPTRTSHESDSSSSARSSKEKPTDIPAQDKCKMPTQSITFDTEDDELSISSSHKRIQSKKSSSTKMKNTDSSSSETSHGKDATTVTTDSSKTNHSAQSVLNAVPRLRDEHSSSPDSDGSSMSSTNMKYIFDAYTNDIILLFLHGPVRQRLIKEKHYPISPSGYCQALTESEGRVLKKLIHDFLPYRVKSDPVRFDNKILSLVSSTCTAEKVFEDNSNQTDYAITTDPCTVTFDVEVIYPPRSDSERSESTSPTDLTSVSDKSQSSLSDAQCHISSTNSSIDLVYGDISQIEVDVMICVMTSITLLKSVLMRAGPTVRAEYEKRYRTESFFFLDGGSTLAKKILFVPWKSDVQLSDISQIQQSLAELVQKCIRTAHQQQAKSIAFPSIGTGLLGVNIQYVCEAMIDSANETLQHLTMNVLFVIYPSKVDKKSDSAYQSFQTYLNALTQQNETQATYTACQNPTSPAKPIPIDRHQYICHTWTCTNLVIISNMDDVHTYDEHLLRSLEKLIVTKEYDFSLIHKPFLKSDILIDTCFDHNVLPTIDYSKGKLILQGDSESCSQCFSNLRGQQPVYKYYLLSKNKSKNEEIPLNTYVTLKIDEAKGNGESMISIRDDLHTIYEIDLDNLQVLINRSSQTQSLIRKQIDDNHKILPPSIWPSLNLMIQTVNLSPESFPSLPCVRTFEYTMAQSKLSIERIEAIQNWPLYVHFVRKKSKTDTTVFHACPLSSVTSIIHYGFHSESGSIEFARQALKTHIHNAYRSTNGRYYMFVVILSKNVREKDLISLSNDDAHLALPTHLITYKQ
ncbi:unnamed protein product [Adineta ricciae]|uniref:Macro domain-containing protein n=1 Tax=Adineta ricciae TaxID=249248 RepID=A0A813NIN3_ADIRI|nr:unnamed protein product [Adineta ricciae]CAF0889617.1 unnamed protein product [Adineta ricciae]